MAQRLDEVVNSAAYIQIHQVHFLCNIDLFECGHRWIIIGSIIFLRVSKLFEDLRILEDGLKEVSIQTLLESF